MIVVRPCFSSSLAPFENIPHATQVDRLRALLLPNTDADLAFSVRRCPALLTMRSRTVEDKLRNLQEALPAGVDAR